MAARGRRKDEIVMYKVRVQNADSVNGPKLAKRQQRKYGQQYRCPHGGNLLCETVRVAVDGPVGDVFTSWCDFFCLVHYERSFCAASVITRTV